MTHGGALIFWIGSSLNEHVDFHCCVIDGVFEPAIEYDQRITWQVKAGAITRQAAPARRGATRNALLRFVTHAGAKSTIDCATQWQRYSTKARWMSYPFLREWNAMLELYHHGTSVCAAKPRIVLAEKWVAWEGRYVDILKGEQFRPEYKELNPKAVVPTLVHDGRVILESTIICEYLDEVFPAPPLKPDEPGERAQMRMWNKRIDEEGFPVTGPLTYAISHRHAVIANGPEAVSAFVNSLGPAAVERRRRRLELGIEDEEAQSSLRIWDRFLADMERWLSHHEWLAGGRFSLAEACMTPFMNRLDMLQLSFMW